MPNTYQLFPGLKQILEDKRIRRFGVPDEEYQNYLMAEQFVVDMRNITPEEKEDALETLRDMNDFGLYKGPCEKYILHFIHKVRLVGTLKEMDKIISIYIVQAVNMKEFQYYTIHDSYSEYLNMQIMCENNDEAESSISVASSWANAMLILMLATRNIIKEKHENKKSQQPVNGKPHKKGSGGYTLLRPPEAHEIKDGTGTHASPRPHFRRGHIRKLHQEDKTQWIFVSPCFVNGEPEVARKAYLVA